MTSPESPRHIADLAANFAFQGYIPSAEHRAITVSQLQRLLKYATDNCTSWHDVSPHSASFGKALSVDTLNLYQINDWILKPATKENNCSFVELLTPCAQLPSWFMSHWWGESVRSFLRCVEMHIATRCLAGDGAYWVCAYANRQNSLDSDVCADPQQTSFYRAMQLAEGVLLVLDDATETSGPATPFSRIWCAFEQSVALDYSAGKRMLLDIVACSGDGVHLITDGVAEADRRSVFPSKRKSERESTFPLSVINHGLRTQIENAKASVEMDRIRILNCIAGRDLEATPPLSSCAMYSAVNHQIRSIFAVAIWRLACETGVVAKLRLPEILKADTARKSLSLDFTACQGFDFDDAVAIAESFPANLEDLSLVFRDCRQLGDGGVAALAGALPNCLSSLSLNFVMCPSLGDAGVAALGNKLPPNLEGLHVLFWGNDRLGPRGLVALSEGLPKCLRRLKLSFRSCLIDDSALAALANSLPSSLDELILYFTDCSRIGDSGVAAIAHALPRGLHGLELHLGQCAQVGDPGVAALAVGFPESLTTFSLELAGTAVSSEVRALVNGDINDRADGSVTEAELGNSVLRLGAWKEASTIAAAPAMAMAEAATAATAEVHQDIAVDEAQSEEVPWVRTPKAAPLRRKKSI